MPHAPRLIRLLSTAIICALVVASAAAQSSHGPRKTLDSMIGALGGKAFLNVREIHNEGRYYSFYRGELDGGNVFADYIRFPDAERTETGPAKNKTVTINNGGVGWSIQGLNVWEQSDDEIADFSTSFETSYEYVTRFSLSDPDIAFVDLGAETVEFKRADVVEFRDESKNRLRYYIDRDTHLPLKMQVRLANDTLIREEAYSNWHKINDVLTPMFVARYRDGVKVMEIRLESVSYNAGLADSLFAP